MHRVLIITYYWPPSGGSAVLRWLKFAKYLREFGWEPVIYTPANPEPQEIDKSLLQDIPANLEILKTHIYEPYGIYKRVTGKKPDERLGVALMNQNGKQGIVGKLSLWIRSNVFIPDPRMFWIRPSARYLARYLKQHPVEAVITTGPPHSIHLIGLQLKMKTGITWLADFRDPWTRIDFYNDLLLTCFADYCHKKLEKKVLAAADHIITVSPGMTGEFRQMGAKNVTTITNGYDELPVSDQRSQTAKFTLLHLGSMPKSRNPLNLWKVLSDLVHSDPIFASRLEIQLIGKADQSVNNAIAEFNLDEYVKRASFIPHHQTSERLVNASLLLLCINNTPNAKGILTNKFFEYLSARRPIIAIGPTDGDAAIILAETKAGRIFQYDETSALKNHLLSLFDLYSQGKLHINSSGIEKYSRKNLTGQLSALLNTVKS